MVNIKMVINVIVKPLTFICNQSFLAGIFPHGMKIAKVIPISKSGEKNIFSNYWLISILPQLSKDLEKLFEVRLSDYLSLNHKILNENQY